MTRLIDEVISFRTGFIGLALLVGTGTVDAADEKSLFFAGESICPKDVIDIPRVVLDAYGGDNSTQEIVLESDSIDQPDADTLELNGNAQVVQGSQAVYAQSISYNKSSYSLTARDGVTLITPNADKLTMAELNLEMETLIGDADQVAFQLAKRKSKKSKRRIRDSEGFRTGANLSALVQDQAGTISEDGSEELTGLAAEVAATQKKKVKKPKVGIDEVHAELRGEADKIFLEGPDRQRMKKAALTGCPVGQDSVFIKASDLILDHAAGVGIGTNMTVRFFGVPIWYFPKASFPINNERKTGFLFPSVGTSDESGTIVEIPYYLNIAPNQDATFNLKYMSDRGAQVRGEYRYLGETFDGIFRAEYLPDDEIYGDDRYGWTYKHNQRFSENWQADANLQDVSDPDYTDDFPDRIDLFGTNFLRQRLQARYRNTNTQFTAKLQDYVSADASIDETGQPYALKPSLEFSTKTPRAFAGGNLELGIKAEYDSFDHPSDTRIVGDRTILTPYIMAPLDAVYGYVKPKLSVVSNSYSFDNAAAGTDDSPSFSVPIFSVDAGVAFERDTSWGGKPHYQTLEPRAFYVYAPEEEDQELIPDFDTGGGDSNSISNFYRENRFFGGDRVGDANRLTLGVSTRVIDSDSGEQRLKAEVAQMFHFDDREIQVNPDDKTETEDLSDLIADVRANINPFFEVGANLRYSHEESETESFTLDMKYQKDARRRFNMDYTWDNDGDEQVAIEGYFPLGQRWQALVKETYDIDEGESRRHSIGIAYDACCWAARVSFEERVRRNTQTETQFNISLELKNLGQVSTAY